MIHFFRYFFKRCPGEAERLCLRIAGETARPPLWCASDTAVAPWCPPISRRARDTLVHRKYCGQDPTNCIILLPHFSLSCLDAGFLRFHRQYRDEITVLGGTREAGDDNREFRYAAHRHFIFWQHGSLVAGNRRVIPSCCIWKIRDTFSDPLGQYIGFIPGIWGSSWSCK